MPNRLPNRSFRISPKSSAWTGEPSALSAKVLKEHITITSVTKKAEMFLATFPGNRSPISKTPLRATNAFGSWSINTLNSWWKRPEPKDRPAQKKRPHSSTSPRPRGGNPPVDEPLRGRRDQWRGRPATRRAGAHRPVQAGQRPGGLFVARSCRAHRCQLSAQGGSTAQRAGAGHDQLYFWIVPPGARLLLPRREKGGPLSGRCRVGIGRSPYAGFSTTGLLGGSS